MKAILSADRNWGIGYQNKLLVTIPSDMRFFRETTTGKVIVLGRKTLETFPGGLPLKNRVNIVLTHDKSLQVKDAVVVHDLEELMEELKKYPETRIDMAYQADTFFPDLDQDPEWELVQESDEQTCFDIEFTFTVYRRKQK